VQSAFSQGDAVAIGILEGAANELEMFALSVARRLELVGQPFVFILAAGFSAVPWLEQELERPAAGGRAWQLGRTATASRERRRGAGAAGSSRRRGPFRPINSIECLTPDAPSARGAVRASRVFNHDYAVAKAVARRMADLVTKNRRVVLDLPTGGRRRTLSRARVAARARRGLFRGHHVQPRRVSWDTRDASGSYRSFMEEHLFSHVNIKPENRHFLNGSARDPEAECLRYEREIADAGGIRSAGARHWHQRPHRIQRARAHTGRAGASRQVAAETRAAMRRCLAAIRRTFRPRRSRSGWRRFFIARAIVLLGDGRAKAACIEHVVNGTITPELPASFLQLHDDVDIMLDAGAAEKLQATL
jgi:glucosamine-6-phosphate deaminase